MLDGIDFNFVLTALDLIGVNTLVLMAFTALVTSALTLALGRRTNRPARFSWAWGRAGQSGPSRPAPSLAAGPSGAAAGQSGGVSADTTAAQAAPAQPDDPPPAVARIVAIRRAKKMLSPEVAVVHFLDFLRKRGLTGWFAAESIDELWLWFANQADIVPINTGLIREMLAAMPACRHGQRRLNSPEFASVRLVTGRSRASVYYIPPISQNLPLPGEHRFDARHDTVIAGVSLDRVRQPAGKTVAGARKPSRKRVLQPVSGASDCGAMLFSEAA